MKVYIFKKYVQIVKQLNSLINNSQFRKQKPNKSRIDRNLSNVSKILATLK